MHLAHSPLLAKCPVRASGRRLTREQILAYARRDALDRRRLADEFRAPEREADAIAAALDPMPRSLRDAFRRDLLPILSAAGRTVQASVNLRCDVVDRRQFPAPLTHALDRPWIAFGRRGVWHALALDVDHTGARELADRLPPALRPWIVTDPHSLRALALWPLRFPVFEARATRRTMNLLRLVLALAAVHFDATPLPPSAVVKNPAGLAEHLAGPLRRHSTLPACATTWDAWSASASPLCWWTTPGGGAVTLSDLADALRPLAGDALDAKHTAEAAAAAASRSARGRFHRGDPLPDDMTIGGYLFPRLMSRFLRRPTGDLGAIEVEAFRLVPLCDDRRDHTKRGVEKVAARVHRYIDGYMARLPVRPKKAKAAPVARVPLAERQADAARTTNAKRRSATDDAIAGAVAAMTEAGERITGPAVAARAGVSLRAAAGRLATMRKAAAEHAKGIAETVHDAVPPITEEGSTRAPRCRGRECWRPRRRHVLSSILPPLCPPLRRFARRLRLPPPRNRLGRPKIGLGGAESARLRAAVNPDRPATGPPPW